MLIWKVMFNLLDIDFILGHIHDRSCKKYKKFPIQENAFEIVICQNGGHFVQGEMR